MSKEFVSRAGTKKIMAIIKDDIKEKVSTGTATEFEKQISNSFLSKNEVETILSSGSSSGGGTTDPGDNNPNEGVTDITEIIPVINGKVAQYKIAGTDVTAGNLVETYEELDGSYIVPSTTEYPIGTFAKRMFTLSDGRMLIVSDNNAIIPKSTAIILNRNGNVFDMSVNPTINVFAASNPCIQVEPNMWIVISYSMVSGTSTSSNNKYILKLTFTLWKFNTSTNLFSSYELATRTINSQYSNNATSSTSKTLYVEFKLIDNGNNNYSLFSVVYSPTYGSEAITRLLKTSFTLIKDANSYIVENIMIGSLTSREPTKNCVVTMSHLHVLKIQGGHLIFFEYKVETTGVNTYPYFSSVCGKCFYCADSNYSTCTEIDIPVEIRSGLYPIKYDPNNNTVLLIGSDTSTYTTSKFPAKPFYYVTMTLTNFTTNSVTCSFTLPVGFTDSFSYSNGKTPGESGSTMDSIVRSYDYINNIIEYIGKISNKDIYIWLMRGYGASASTTMHIHLISVSSDNVVTVEDHSTLITDRWPYFISVESKDNILIFGRLAVEGADKSSAIGTYYVSDDITLHRKEKLTAYCKNYAYKKYIRGIAKTGGTVGEYIEVYLPN